MGVSGELECLFLTPLSGRIRCQDRSFGIRLDGGTCVIVLGKVEVYAVGDCLLVGGCLGWLLFNANRSVSCEEPRV
jgi:hypothetical protein